MAEVRVTTGDILYGTVCDKKESVVSLKLDGMIRKDVIHTLLGTPVKVSSEKIVEVKHMVTK